MSTRSVIPKPHPQGLQRYDRDGVTYVHLLNYRYDENEDRVLPIEDVELTLRNVADHFSLITPENIPLPGISIKRDGDETQVSLKNIGLYTILRFCTKLGTPY